MLANSSLNLNAGTALTGGGSVSLGGSVTLNLDTTKVPTLGAATNTFAGSISASSFTGNGSGLTNLNAATLGGLGPSAYQSAGSYASTGANTFTDSQNVGGNITATGTISGSSASLSGGLTGTTANFSGALSAAGATLLASGTATLSSGASSNPLDLQASSFNSGTQAAVPQDFRWLVEPAGNNTGTPSATLNLAYGSGTSVPALTGLSINNLGQITFTPGQTFPGGGTVTSVASGAGLTGGPITGSGTLSISPGGVTNTMLANSSLILNAGTDLTGGGPVSLGGSVTLNLDTTTVPTLGAATNTFAGSISATSFTGSGSGLTNVNAATLGGLGPSALAQLGAASNIFAGSVTATSFTGNGAGLTNVGALTAATATNALNLGGLPPNAYQPAGSYASTAPGAYIPGSLPEWTGTPTGTATLGSAPIADAFGSLTSSEPLVAPSVTTTGPGTPTVLLGNSGPSWTSGSGAPTAACVVGSLYSRTDGGAGTALYVCEAASGTWSPK
jgi:hypothetical protein